MASWYLYFNHPSSIMLQDLERLAETIVGARVALTLGEISGNPRDFYDRSIEGTGERDGILVSFRTTQGLRSPDDPDPHISSLWLTLASDTAPFAAKLALWHTVQEALAPLGFTDHTLTQGGAEIIDEAQATGDLATANRLRDAKAGTLIAQAPRIAHVSLTSPRTDIEPILAAYPRPAEMSSMSLCDCRLTALPPSFFKFTALRSLSLEEDAFEGSVLRGVSLPELEQLRFRGQGVRSIAKEDLAGFPALEVLSCTDCPLTHLDPEILDVCPKLIRVYIEYTPLWRDREAELRARWPRVLWRYDEGYVEGKKVDPSKGRGVAPKRPPPFEIKQAPAELQPFFDEIVASRDDDAPRLELADYLTARGDKRGEHIRLSCELAKLEPDDPRYQKLRDEVARLPEFVFFSGTYYPFLGLYQARRRGFMEHVECSGIDFVYSADVLMRDAPIRGLTLSSGAGAADVAQLPALASLRELHLHQLTDDDRAALLRSPYLEKTLWRVAVGGRLEDAADVGALAAELEPLRALRALELRGALEPAAIPALAELVKTRGFTQLDVEFCSIEPKSAIEQLWAELGELVRPRRLPRVSFDSGVLDLANARYSLEQMRAVIATGEFRAATELRLHHTNLGDALLKYVATSRALPNLVALSLGGSGVSDVGVTALAATAVALDQLQSIHLGEVGRDGRGVSEGAIEALARSPRLPALRRIGRDQEHHAYSDGAREDYEVRRIQRSDGTVVEFVIGHTIWP